MKHHTHPYHERASYAWTDDSVRLMATPSSHAKSLYFYIQEAGYFKTMDSYFTERKNLNSFLIVYTLSGRGILQYKEKTWELQTGDCFFINCLDYHYYETLKKSSWEFLWIHFNGNNALGYYEEYDSDHLPILSCEDPDTIITTMREIIAINKKRNATTELLTSNLIHHLLTGLLMQKISHQTQNIFIPDYLKQVLKDIDRNFKTPLTLDSLASSHGISKFYLSREFKKYIGVTVNEYIITTRISYAKELLKYSDLSVNEIAFAVGMNHVSHFINLFSSREDKTPLAYRKEWRM